MLRRSGASRGTRIHRFLVYYGNTRVGVADVHEDRTNAVCALIVGIAKAHRGKRIGTIASRALLRKCFLDFNARRVESSAISSNSASLAMQDGMVEEGRAVERFKVGNELFDEVRFRLLKREWEQQVASRTAPPA
jgi:RimJ/RimL family protein N-acetyltransferase